MAANLTHGKKFLVVVLVLVLVLVSIISTLATDNFKEQVDITWGDGRAKILNQGTLLTLSLDKASGSGFQSKYEYLFARIDVEIKLVPGNSAGTVVAYYLSSQGASHDEIDFEFLGNTSGEPYTVHTNLFTKGRGGREQQFFLWFDPTSSFHTYSIIWNPQSITWYVDGTPIREYRNLESQGIPYPSNQAMRVYSSLWDADDWATRGGLVKTDWSKAPFTASFENFEQNGCNRYAGKSSCSSKKQESWLTQRLDANSLEKMKWVQNNYMIYNYCNDVKRFPQGFPGECTIS